MNRKRIDPMLESMGFAEDRKNKGRDEDPDVWWANITHNMNKMADTIPVSTNDDRVEATLYDYVWRPEEQREKVDSTVMLRVLTEGINYMISNRKKLLKFNPENGWG